MAKFASGTHVSADRSQEQIKATLRRYGAGRFGVIEDVSAAAVMFEIRGLMVRIDVPLPRREDPAFTTTPAGRDRTESAAYSAYEQAVKQRWRALLLAIKAKLEAVECGISTIEREFMPFMVMPDGRVLADHLLPQLEAAVRDGRMPKALPLLGN